MEVLEPSTRGFLSILEKQFASLALDGLDRSYKYKLNMA